MPRDEYTIPVVVPRRKVVRVKRTKGKFLIDFRGIRGKSVVVPANYAGKEGAFTSPAKLQYLVDEYFASCQGPMLDKWGALAKDGEGELIIGQNRPYTVSGLALHLGLPTSSFCAYCAGIYDEVTEGICEDVTLSKILHIAKQRINEYCETRLYDREGNVGAKFVLDRAFGWVGSKEMAEIVERRAMTLLRQKEFALKVQMYDEGDNPDQNLTVNIVRANKREEE